MGHHLRGASYHVAWKSPAVPQSTWERRERVGAGQRWRAVGLEGEAVGAVAVAARVVYAGTTGDGSDFEGNLFARTRRGSWKVVLPGDDVDLDLAAVAVDPQSPTTVDAATNNAGIVKSTDGGANWVAFGSGLADRTVFSLAIGGGSSALYSVTLDGGVFRRDLP